jgi:non-specific riboncleoside hydrolase
MKKVHKVIIDTDPGVDDITALTFALNDPQFDIKLITITSGNIHLDQASKNACHLLDIFERDIPVVNGYSERIGGSEEYAYHVHGINGCGWYVPPKTTKHNPLKVDCADAMYEVFRKYPKQVTMVILGPHTNFAHLLIKHPDVTRYIKKVVMMGGSLSGIRSNPNHRSFNIRTDAPAFKCTVDSQIPVVMCPSKIGRDITYFTEEQVKQIGKTNDIGKFLQIVFQTYWEPEYPEKTLSNCDLSAIYYVTHPELYKTRQAFVDVDIDVNVGTTIGHYDRKGYFSVVQTVNREKFQSMIFKKLDELSSLKVTNRTFKNNLSGKNLSDEQKKALDM